MQLFDLNLDPSEQNDRAWASPEEIRRARSDLASLEESSAALRERYGIRGESPAELDPETIEQLRSLGYVR